MRRLRAVTRGDCCGAFPAHPDWPRSRFRIVILRSCFCPCPRRSWPVSHTQMLVQGLPACVAELYGLFFSCSALIMRAIPDSRAASSRV
jgi:hypothetical protein